MWRELRTWPLLCGGRVLDSSGWVTMLMLVMPARFTASMTEAKMPKGTVSSART